MPVFDAIHASPECVTYSMMAQAKHKREEGNGYQGVTPEAFNANLELKRLLNIIELQLERNPNLIFTIENPYNEAGGVHKQPAVINLLEKPRVEGGLGATRCLLSYCLFGEGYKKPTLLWTNSPHLIQRLGDKKAYCGGQQLCTAKQRYGKHQKSIRGIGDSVKSSAFPHAFAKALAEGITASVHQACSASGVLPISLPPPPSLPPT